MTLCVVVSAGVLVGIHMYVYILYSGFFVRGKISMNRQEHLS